MVKRDYSFGDLNNINLPNSERDIPVDSDGLRVIQDSALKQYKTDILEEKTEWVGEVLRSWQDSPANSSSFWKNSPYVGKITKCKVNIPELEEAIGKEPPCPDDDPNKRGAHQEKINKFKTFEARDLDLPPPPVGTDVRVTFEDPQNPHNSAGIYLGPVNVGSAATGEVAGPGQAPQRKPAPAAAPTPAPPAIAPKATFKNPSGKVKTVLPETQGNKIPLSTNVKDSPDIIDSDVKMGIYWDYPHGRGVDKDPKAWAKKAKEFGFTDLALMVGLSTHGVAPVEHLSPNGKVYWKNWKPDQIKNFTKECTKLGIEVSCVWWPNPHKKWIDNFIDSPVVKTMVESGCKAIEFDMEGNWAYNKMGHKPKKKEIEDKYGSMLEAEKDLMERLRKKLDENGGSNIQINITCHPARLHKRNEIEEKEGSKYYLLSTADRLYFQIYSTQRRVTYRKGDCAKSYNRVMNKYFYKKEREIGKDAFGRGSMDRFHAVQQIAQAAKLKCQNKYKFSGKLGPGKFQRSKINDFIKKETGTDMDGVILAIYSQHWPLDGQRTGTGVPPPSVKLTTLPAELGRIPGEVTFGFLGASPSWTQLDDIGPGPGDGTEAGLAQAIKGLELAALASLEYPTISSIRYWSTKWVWHKKRAQPSAIKWAKMFKNRLKPSAQMVAQAPSKGDKT